MTETNCVFISRLLKHDTILLQLDQLPNCTQPLILLKAGIQPGVLQFSTFGHLSTLQGNPCFAVVFLKVNVEKKLGIQDKNVMFTIAVVEKITPTSNIT